MKTILRIAALLFAVTAAPAGAKDPMADALPENYGEVVFVRGESHGSLNILPSTVTHDGWQRVVLVGGQAGSFYLKEGDYAFQVFSPEPYQRESPPDACRSPAFRVNVKKEKRVFVEVVPEPGDESAKRKFSWSLKEKRG